MFSLFLWKPETEKDSHDESNEKLNVGYSSMQGWRESQEDAHNCILNYDTNTSYFAVYDGHGGHEVAKYCSEKLPEYIKQTAEYKEDKISEALTNGYLGFDATLITPEILQVLETMAGEQEAVESEDEENVNNLYEEATMPIEKVIEKYKSKIAQEVLKQIVKDQKAKLESSEEVVDTSDNSAGPSSSTVSAPDSSGDGVTSSSEADTQPETKGESNGASADSTDAKGGAQNGEVSESGDAQAKSKEDEPSSAKADVCTSSTSENGSEAAASPSKKGKGKAVIKPITLSTRVSPRTRPDAQALYKDWLDMGGEDSEDSDEADETFQGADEADESEDEHEGVNIAISADGSDESEEEEEEDDDDEEEETDGVFLRRGPGYDSGCTAVVAVVRGGALHVANAGDSRCVVSRRGRAIEMSFDHKPEDAPEQARIRKAGGCVADGRIDGGLNLSRAVGDHNYKRNEKLTDREQMITALPDVKSLELRPGEDEFMVLACDGIWNSMSSQEVVDFVRQRLVKVEESGGRLSTICEEMFSFCLAPNAYDGDGTGCDNMTAIIVRFKGGALKRLAEGPEENEAKRVKTDNEEEVDTTV